MAASTVAESRPPRASARLDATQSVRDRGARPLVAEIVERAHTAGGDRSVFVVAENEPQHSVQLRRPDEGGYGLDGMWKDDFHHGAFAQRLVEVFPLDEQVQQGW
jgi:1,4-alpha-glucan branching enzyme